MRSDIVPGGIFPDYELPNHTGTLRKLSELQGDDLVLKPGLVIYSIYNGYWFWGRPSVADLWRDLRVVTSEICPDWDLSTPGLREASASRNSSANCPLRSTTYWSLAPVPTTRRWPNSISKKHAATLRPICFFRCRSLVTLQTRFAREEPCSS